MPNHNISASLGSVYLKKWAIFQKMIPQFSDTSIFPKGFGEVLKAYADTSAKAYKLEEAVTEAKDAEDNVLGEALEHARFYTDIVKKLKSEDKTIAKDFNDFMTWVEKFDPSRARTTWKAFKKDHPLFEKHRQFKVDFGPKLDKWSAAHDRTAALAEAEKKQTGVADKMFKGLTSYIAIYSKALERAALDDRVKVKFMEFLIDLKADRAALS